jgi:hypothetical protein
MKAVLVKTLHSLRLRRNNGPAEDHVASREQLFWLVEDHALSVCLSGQIGESNNGKDDAKK